MRGAITCRSIKLNASQSQDSWLWLQKKKIIPAAFDFTSVYFCCLSFKPNMLFCFSGSSHNISSLQNFKPVRLLLFLPFLGQFLCYPSSLSESALTQTLPHFSSGRKNLSLAQGQSPISINPYDHLTQDSRGQLYSKAEVFGAL